MYVPSHFAQTDQKSLYDLIDTYPFGLLVMNTAEGIEAAHLPFVLDREQRTLRCHVAKANPIWQAVTADAKSNSSALAIFSGPHAYISPDWYASSGLVPTWNYAAVHVYGRPRLLDGDELMRLLDDLSATNEKLLLPKPPWTIDKVPADMYAKLRRAIVGIEIPCSELQGKQKLSQNRRSEDQQGVIGALQNLTGDNQLAVAKLMTEQSS